MAKKSELARWVESLQIMLKYDKGHAYAEISGEDSFIPCNIDPTKMSVADRKAILDLGVFNIVCYGDGGKARKMWNTESEREDGDVWTFDENFNVLTQGDY